MARLRTVAARSDLRGLVDELVSDGARGEQLSMYIDLDPREFATAPARKSGITAAVNEAERAAPSAEWAPLLQEVRQAFSEARYEIEDAQGLLVIAQPGETPTLVKLPRPVAPHVGYGHGVHVRPLLEVLPGERYCVLLCNRRSARMLLGDRDGFGQVGAFADDVEGQHDQGGWSQARYQRVIEGQVADHLRHTARVVFELQESDGFDRLLVAMPEELRGEFETHLHDYTRRVLSGWLDLDVEHSHASDVARCAARTIAGIEAQQQRELLERIQQLAGRGQRAALGVDDVLRALVERRVETLVVAGGFSEPGFACEHGDWLAARAEPCPVHGPALEPVGDVVEAAIEEAIRQSARIVTIARVDPRDALGDDGTTRDREEYLRLRSFGSIAAALRFDLEDEGPVGPGPR